MTPVNSPITPLGTKIRTHEKCPESGVWKALHSPSTNIFFLKGDRFPPYKGEQVEWQLRSYS